MRYRFVYDVLDRLLAESGFDHKLTGYRYNAGNALVEQRMLSTKELRGMTADQISGLRRISDIPRSAQFWDAPTKSWQPVRSAHMGHVGEDVVDYWNRRGKFFCQKLPEVRSWMRDSNNYRLEKGAGKGGNFYRGTQNLSRYDMTDPIGPRQKSNYGHD